MKPQEAATKLAADHWGYIEKLLATHGTEAGRLDIIGFHYRTAMEHGFKHGVEWEYDRAAEEAFLEDVIDHVTLEAELDRSCGDAGFDLIYRNKTETRLTQCPKCLDEKQCGGVMMNGNGECLHYRPNLRERILDAKQEAATGKQRVCHTCFLYPCDTWCGYPSECSAWTPTAKQEAPTAAEQTLDFTLPSITLKCTAEEAAGKFWSEREEWKSAEKGSIHELVERWDCLQALYTFAERGGEVDWYQDHVRVVMEDLARYHADGGDVVRAKRQMLRKNAKRGYYSPVVNEVILSTCGHHFTPVLGGPA